MLIFPLLYGTLQIFYNNNIALPPEIFMCSQEYKPILWIVVYSEHLLDTLLLYLSHIFAYKWWISN